MQVLDCSSKSMNTDKAPPPQKKKLTKSSVGFVTIIILFLVNPIHFFGRISNNIINFLF